MIYKKHEITTICTERGPLWIIDGNRATGYQSGKDARAAINGTRPRWPAVDISQICG